MEIFEMQANYPGSLKHLRARMEQIELSCGEAWRNDKIYMDRSELLSSDFRLVYEIVRIGILDDEPEVIGSGVIIAHETAPDLTAVSVLDGCRFWAMGEYKQLLKTGDLPDVHLAIRASDFERTEYYLTDFEPVGSMIEQLAKLIFDQWQPVSRKGGPPPAPEDYRVKIVLGWIEAQRRGETQSHYCAREGIGASTLRKWRRDLEAAGRLPPS